MCQAPHKDFKEWEQNYLQLPYLLCAGYHAKQGEALHTVTYYVQAVCQGLHRLRQTPVLLKAYYVLGICQGD